MPITIGIDEKIVKIFSKYIDRGLEKVSISVIVLMSIFAMFDLYIALTSELSDLKSVLKTLGRKALNYGLWFAIVRNYTAITNAIFESFVNIGGAFGGSESLSMTEFLSIDTIATEGFKIIVQVIGYMHGFNTFLNIHYFFFYLIMVVIMFFFYMSAIAALVIAKIQFKLIVGLGLILLVFITLEFTKEIGMKAIQGILHSALDITVLYSILNITFFVILKEIPLPKISLMHNKVVDMATYFLLFVTLMYMASQYKQITNLIMYGHGGISGAGLGSSVAAGISKATTAIIMAVATVYTAGGALAASGTGGAASGSKISEIFKGGMEGYKKSKNTRDTIRNVGNIASEGTSRVTGNEGNQGQISRNINDLFSRFKKKKKKDDEDV